MTDLSHPTEKNYLRTTVVGSFWNVLQFTATFIVGTVVSIVLTRHFGAQNYGLLAYLIWFSIVTQLILNFGLLTTTQTWIPKYYFTGDIARAAFVARQLLKIQLIVASTAVILLIPTILIWPQFVSFSTAEFTRLMFINLLPIVSTMLIVFFSTLLVALQRFKQSALIYITGQVLSLLTVLVAVHLNFGIGTLLLLLSSVNVLVLILFVRASRDILRTIVSEWHGESIVRSIIRFSGWAYLNSILTAVIWDKSAFFFLGKFESSATIAIFGIAYTLAATVVSLFDPIVNVFTTMLAELVAKRDWDRVRLIIRLCAKYVSLVLLPLIVLAYAISPYIIRFVYGTEFGLVAAIFPWLLLAASVNRIFTPAWSIPQYMHDLNRIVPRNLLVASFNIILGVILIPRFGIWGAVIATVATQVSALLYFSVFIQRYSLRLFTREYGNIIALNAVFFGLIFLTVQHQAPFYQSFAITMAGIGFYGLFVFKKMINLEDKQLLSKAVYSLKHRVAV